MNLAGQRIGRFAIERELGQGMAGSVWLARDPQSLRQVAIKLLHHPLEVGSPRTERFQREVRALLTLRHPAVVPLLEVGMHEGRSFLVLAHFAGGSLERRLKTRGKLEPRQAARLVLRLAEGLELAHKNGILHRDLTPANVLLSAADEPAIADFGLARFTRDEGESLTRSGAFYGSPGYLSPEQARGDSRELGVGTDVYGLGGVLYACLTTQPPLSARTLPEALSAAVDSVPRPPSEVARGVPAELDRICARCLEKRPADRFPSAGAFAASLQGFLAAPSMRRQRQRARTSPWLTIALTLPGIVGATLVLGYVLGKRSDDAPVARTQLEHSASEPSVTEPGKQVPTPQPTPESTQEDPPVEVEPPPPTSERDRVAAEATVQRALTALRAGEYDEVVTLMSEALRLYPESPKRAHWHGLRGHGYFESKRFAQAEEDLSLYLAEIEGGYPTYQRGICNFLLGDVEGSLSDLNRALVLDPKLHAAYYWRAAVSLASGGDPVQARKDVETYLARQRTPHPDLEAARSLLEKLKSEQQ